MADSNKDEPTEPEETDLEKYLKLHMDKTALCWICKGCNPDDSGRPPLRDCSCQDDGEGFAHFSCIVKIAVLESLEWSEDDAKLDKFTAPWGTCPNCNRFYKHQLALDLATACVDFVDKKFPDCDWRHLTAYHLKLGPMAYAIGNDGNATAKHRREFEKLAHKCLSIIKHLKTKEEFLLRRRTILSIASDVYGMLGLFELHSKHVTEDGAKQGIKYLQKARDIYKVLEVKEGVVDMENKIAELNSKMEKKFGKQYGRSDEEDVLEKQRIVYETMKETLGDAVSLAEGRKYALALKEADHMIGAERLLRKLVLISQQNHGPDHNTTKDLESLLSSVATRYVTLLEAAKFQALRYESNGKQTVIQGPVTHPRNPSEEKIHTVDTKNIFPVLGTPVVCHGLKDGFDLNGKIGEIRDYHVDAKRYAIHFEDDKIPPKAVKRENLRILFELPETVE